MAELLTIARPYAEAAFGIARDKNALPVWSEMLRLAAAVGADPQMQNALASPKLGAAEKESLFLSVVGDKLDTEGRNFIRVLIENDRISLLPEIRRLFEMRKDTAENVARAEIETALPMTDGQLASLTAALQKRFGKRVEANVILNAALIGGARITVGDTVIDGSVQGKLTAMANQLSG
jgi:F-type H+-transporting ATPase subunit delta